MEEVRDYKLKIMALIGGKEIVSGFFCENINLINRINSLQ